MKDCPIHPKEDCPAHNRHHQAWPRRHYKTPLEKQYRQLFTVWMCVEAHKLLHATTLPPRKPNAREMRIAIEAKQKERNGG